ncbi:MAPEG family protein [Steroidobacter cummioxidans]|uniref:MAPEG family protein n=1 Tax=Steroidobacter cummioxidans TaxID=1803913 RepID=UPI0013799A0F|nr:MAPEG family protein [Steroidobacter cummioxidans]
MQIQHAILLPPTALALLTGAVFIKLYRDRIAEMRSRRIHPQQLANAKQVHETLQNVAASDHFRNLFEVPVLFYALCGFLAITQLTTALLLACAWGYVVLRAAHTYVHLTSNRVIRRFQLFFASSIVLYVMWALFAARLLTA